MLRRAEVPRWHDRLMKKPDVLAIADAPNWAQMRFGLAEDELDLRVLRGVRQVI
jgi:hypothetical protein